MKLTVLTSIFKWLDEGHTVEYIAKWSDIDIEIIQSIDKLRNTPIHWKFWRMNMIDVGEYND